MKKIILFLLYINFGLIYSQENTIKLIDVLHGKQIETIAENLKEFNPNSIDIESSVIAIKKELSALYTKQYTNQDIQSLVTFYNSETGKKLLQHQNTINRDVTNAIFKWENKLQGLDILEDDLALIPDMEVDANDTEISASQDTKNAKAIPEKTVPKVNTIDDLKRLIKEDSNILFDSMLLAELLDVEELLNPIEEIEDALPETDIKKKN